MTIVFLTPRFYPEIGGVEKHAYEIAKRLSKRNKVIVITEGNKNKKERINGIKVIRLSFGKNDWLKKFIVWKKILDYRDLIKKADVVHCHDVFFWYLPLRLIYPRKKVYVTFHGYETFFPIKSSAIFVRELSEKLTSGNICVGDYIKKWYGTSPTYVTYGAQDGHKVKSQKFSNKKNLKILFVGRIEEDTGVRIYSEALSQLKNYKFEVCGDGSLRKEFEKFGKVNGFVKNLDKYIEKADIIFSSSYLSILFAMGLRKPVFSVYGNALKEDYLKMAPFSRWIYISKSPKVIVNQIKTIERNKKLRERNVSLAYNWVTGETWNKLTKTYLKLWSSHS